MFYILFFVFTVSYTYNSFPEFFDNSVERYSTIFDTSRSASSQERLLVLNKSFELINESPHIGYGLSNSQNITGTAVHNSIVISWLENGILGFLGYIMLYLIILYYVAIGYNKNFYNNGTLMVLAVISIMMITGDMFMANSYKRSLWVPAILFVVYSKHLSNNKIKTNEAI